MLKIGCIRAFATVAMATCGLASACSGGGNGSGETPTPDVGAEVAEEVPDTPALLELPAYFRLEGAGAHSFPDGRTLDCHLDLLFELQELVTQTAEYVEYNGVGGGEVGRRVLAEDESGVAWRADAFGESIVRRWADGRFQIETPINHGVDSRFWEGLAYIDGTFHEDGTMSGSWLCRPFDFEEGGYVDNDLEGEIPWTAAPVEVEEEPEEEGFEQSVN